MSDRVPTHFRMAGASVRAVVAMLRAFYIDTGRKPLAVDLAAEVWDEVAGDGAINVTVFPSAHGRSVMIIDGVQIRRIPA